MRRFAALLTLLFLRSCGPVMAGELDVIHGVPVYGSQVDNPKADFNGSDNETVVIPAGDTRMLMPATEQTALDVVIRGELIVEGRLAVRTLTPHGGTLRLRDGAEIVIRDLPLDHAIDPAEWGHGILALGGGQVIAESNNWRQGSARLAGCVQAGDTTLVFPETPHGWRPGDTLVLHDTRQPSNASELSQETELATVVSVSDDGTVTLTSPVRFDHSCAHGIMPKVGCLTQPITIRSENPDGVRGHVAAVGMSAMYLCGVQAIGMGRTTTEPLSDSNRVGRYALGHFHHYCGLPNETREWQGETKHCSVWDSPKWGWSMHNAYFVNFEDCVAYDCRGGAFITEQVHSYGGQIVDCFACAKSPGSGKRITTDHGGRSSRNDSSPTADHWHDRVGFGLGSCMIRFTGNYAACCKESYGMAGFGTTMLYRPKVRGVMLTSHYDPNAEILGSHMGYGSDPKRYPFLFDTSGNEAFAGWRGIELWSADTYVDYEHGFDGLTLIHCRQSTDLEDQHETVMRGWRILGDYSSPTPVGKGENATYALDFKPAYRFGITAIDCEFKGHGAAYNLIDDSQYTRFERCVFDCPIINYLPLGRKVNVGGAWEGTWDECEFIGEPLFAAGWYPKFDLGLWLTPNQTSRRSLLPTRYFVRPWHDGRDYQVFHYEQHPDYAFTVPPPEGMAYGDWPVGVYTHAELIERGTPIFGDAVPPEAERWGDFYAAPLDCCDVVERLRVRIKELEGN